MRTGLSVALLAAILCASPLALAQRASLADRVAALEQRAAGDRNGTELVNQVSQLRAEVQELRGQIEQLQQQIAQRHGYTIEAHSLVLYVRAKKPQ